MSAKIYNIEGEQCGELPVPKLLNNTPIRQDMVHFTWMNMRRNTNQPHCVSRYAGVQHSAHSWGPGRAVARNPRAHGGIGAYANFCKGGHMYSPTTVNRRWFRKTQLCVKRYATAAALSASCLPQLVEAHGHRIAGIPSFPLVVDIDNVEKTKVAFHLFQKLNIDADIEAVKDSRRLRAGNGKGHGASRRHVQKCGPLLITNGEKVELGFRNIAGVEIVDVHNVNVLQLAPGGRAGRLVVWTKKAFAALDDIWSKKSGFILPRQQVTNSDLESIFASDVYKKAMKPAVIPLYTEKKVDPFVCKDAMQKLNPAFKY